MITIDKNIERPAEQASYESKYPWRHMEIGNSFFVSVVLPGSIRSSASSAGKKHRMKFSVHREGDGFRVWRIA